MKKDKEKKGHVIFVPIDFNRQLKHQILKLEEIGINVTIPDLIVKYAQIGFNQEKL